MASWGVRCGCYYTQDNQRSYLPMVDLEAKATILNNTSRTYLRQTFCNPSGNQQIERGAYTFPLYDGVSVVSFKCFVADRVLEGIVQEKAQAKKTFDKAVSRGETAGLLTQSDDAADVFSTIIGNIPAGGSVKIEICFVGELSHDAEADGIRYTIPTKIAPRYGPVSANPDPSASGVEAKGMKITVDADMRDGSVISKIESPSHMISVSLGVLGDSQDQEPVLTKASATLSLEETVLNQDFVLIVKAKGIETPRAVLETHSSLPNHRAIMATLVPRFALPQIRPEIVFIVDRSGSMSSNISMVISAMKVFLKSLVPGVKFNICSFGSSYKFLWKKSQEYNRNTLTEAMEHVSAFHANMGGTETQDAMEAVVRQRFGDIPLEMILLTDGDITRQQDAFEYMNEQVQESKGQIRLFPLGIGSGVSHSLIQGLARAGNGFAQSVQHGERLEGRLMRMFKGALTPHITDYTLEVQYGDEDDFEMVEKVTSESKVSIDDPPAYEDPTKSSQLPTKEPISLFEPSSNPDADSEPPPNVELPVIPEPTVLQAPNRLPSLYPFQRTSAYLLLSPSSMQKNPVSVVLRGTSDHGPVQLKIPVEVLDEKGSTIHALAARKATQDLEEGRGWLQDAKDKATGKLWREQVPSQMEAIVKREAVRLGTTFQTANRFCSFVAVDANTKQEIAADRTKSRLGIDYARLNGSRLNASISYSRSSRVFSRVSARAVGVPAPAPVPAPQTAGYMPLTAAVPASVPRPAGSPPTEEAEMEDDLGAPDPNVFSYAAAPSAGINARKRSRFLAASNSNDASSGSDEDMGFDLFAGDESALSSHLHSLAPNSYSLALDIPRPDSKPKSPDAKVRELIDEQDFDGWWEANELIASLIGVDVNKLLESKEVASRVWATVMVITFFETSAKAEEEIWEMVVEKAKGWLDSQGANVTALQTRAKGVIGVES